MSIIRRHGNTTDSPFDPTTSRDSSRVDVVASGTRLLVVVKWNLLPQNDTYLKVHTRLEHASEFRGTDCLAIASADNLIVTSLDIIVASTIIAVAIEDIVEILSFRCVI
jgi:hypothetical protein